jgi:hypothetical protein
LLVYDPKKRLSAREALELPLFKDQRLMMPEECYPKPISPDLFEFEFENFSVGKAIFRDLIMDEMLIYNS